jgi:hypothetical protein
VRERLRDGDVLLHEEWFRQGLFRHGLFLRESGRRERVFLGGDAVRERFLVSEGRDDGRILGGDGRRGYSFRYSRSRFVWLRLTGISVAFASFILRM